MVVIIIDCNYDNNLKNSYNNYYHSNSYDKKTIPAPFQSRYFGL